MFLRMMMNRQDASQLNRANWLRAIRNNHPSLDRIKNAF
jgi:hypothetical protein